MGDELSRAVSGSRGPRKSLKVVHPMDTYRQGRRAGIKMGVGFGTLVGVIHELSVHDTLHLGTMVGLVICVIWLIYQAYHQTPNEIAVDVRRSLAIYKDET